MGYLNVTTFDDYLRMLQTCCDITGNTKAYEENGTNVAENIAAIKKKAEGKSAGSVAVLTTYSGGTRVSRRPRPRPAPCSPSWRASNITDADKSLLSDSPGVPGQGRPRFHLPVADGDSDEAAQKALKDQTTANPAWKELTAVKKGRVITLDPKLFL